MGGLHYWLKATALIIMPDAGRVRIRRRIGMTPVLHLAVGLIVMALSVGLVALGKELRWNQLRQVGMGTFAIAAVILLLWGF